MEHIEDGSWEDAMGAENNFQHLEMAKQAQMARALKAGVFGQHQHVVRKNKKRLFEIFNPKVANPRRGV